MDRSKIKAPCTVMLIAANVIVFFVLAFQGMTEDAEFMMKHGAMYVPDILEQGKYYELFASMFLHFGFEHLMNNVIALAAIGWNLEQEMGKLKFLLIYVVSGLGGNILSAYADMVTQDYGVSAGASGAVFGVVGALLYVAIRNKGRIGDISGRGLMIMIAVSLYCGVTEGGINNMAHIGGLAAGFLMGILLYRKKKVKYRTFSGR